MAGIRYMLLLVLVRAADLLAVKDCESVEKNLTGLGCDHPFQIVNDGCYMFSDFQLDYDQAIDYCKSLEHGHMYEISIAMLDYNRYEDQAVLDAVADKDSTFWLGGSTTDGANWYWNDGRAVDIKGLFWEFHEPNEQWNMCMVADTVTLLTTHKRAYAYDHTCSDSLNFICQTGDIKCPPEFIKFGKHCYMQSWNIGVPKLPWDAAREFCKSLNVPSGFHADLVVLGLEDQDDYFLINNLIPDDFTNGAWIGAHQEDTCSFKWVDDRVLALESIYWHSNDPNCGSDHGVHLRSYGSKPSKYFLDDPDTTSKSFVCQMIRD